MMQIIKALYKALMFTTLVLTTNLYADEPVEEIIVKGKVL